MKKKSISITLKFTEKDLNELLEECYFGDGEAPRVRKLTARQFKKLEKELKTSAANFVEEIVYSSRESAANDWLQDLMEEFEPEAAEEDC